MFNARRHLRVHGAVHLMWVIVILVFCCAALITYRPDADRVTAFFGFAATLTSLFLGAIAIFYAMIANQGFSSTLGSLQRSSENVEAAAKNISSTSGALSTQSDRLVAELSQLSPTVLGLSDKIDKISASTTAPTAAARAGSKWWAKKKNSGSVVSLYAIAKSFTEKKPLAPSLVFPDSQVWQQYLLGFLEALYLVPDGDIKVERSDEELGIARPYTITSLGSVPADDLIKAAGDIAGESVKKMKPPVDEYFST